MIKFISSFLAAAVACGSVMSSFASAEGLTELKDASSDSACIEAGFQQYTVDLSGLGALIKRDNVPEDLEHAAYITMTQEDYDELVADPSSYKLCFIASEPVMMRDGIVVSLRNIETADPTVAVPIYAGCKVLEMLDGVFFAFNTEEEALQQIMAAMDGTETTTSSTTTSATTTTSADTTTTTSATTSATTTQSTTTTSATTSATTTQSDTTTSATTSATTTQSTTTTSATTSATTTQSTTTTSATTSATTTQSTTTTSATTSATTTQSTTTESIQPAFYNGHAYAIYSEAADSWEEAKEFCEAAGGKLAVINDAEENEFVYKYMTECGFKSAYFGLSDPNKDGTWSWADGSELTYSNWHSGEPSSQNEMYGMYYYKFSDGTWNDGVWGDNTTAFICEWEYKLGDINNDDIIDAVDASSVLAYYAMISTNKDGGYNECQKFAADVNNDGQVNAVDASNILAYYAYISTAEGEVKTLAEFMNRDNSQGDTDKQNGDTGELRNPDNLDPNAPIELPIISIS